MATQIGTTLLIGGQRTLTNYIVEQDEAGNNEVDFEDVMDEDGERATRIIFRVDEKVTLNLICKSAAAPETDFPEGAMCTDSSLSNYFVVSAPITKTKGARRVSVTLSNIGVT